MSAPPRKEAAIAKVLVVGSVATGKTSFIQRFCRGQFSPHYQTTIGVDFALKKMTVSGEVLNMQLWDIAGQERFVGMARIYYRDAVAAFVAYDVGDRKTFLSVAKWKEDLNQKVFLPNNDPIPVYLLGNKCDIEPKDRQVTREEAELLSKQLGFDGFYETSSKLNVGVTEACESLAQRIHANNHKLQALRRTVDDNSRPKANGAKNAADRSSISKTADSNPVRLDQNNLKSENKESKCC